MNRDNLSAIGNSCQTVLKILVLLAPPLRWSFALLTILTVVVSGATAIAQPQAPLYDECRLDGIFPNGGRRGTTVKVEFKGYGAGLTGPLQILVDGPPGITVSQLKSVNAGVAEASLEIAPQAQLGRRWVRVLNERSGLTNFAQFVVGDLPEALEVEPNNDTTKSQSVTLPVVVNGRVNPQADLDVFQFHGTAGQHVVVAVAAHALDIHGQYKNAGIADFGLELLDAAGRTLATAEDTIGFDPVIEQTLPANGHYFVRVQLLNYAGFPEAVYRLTVGDVPYVVSAFPAGYQRGTDPSIELSGPRVVPGTLVKSSQLPQGRVDGTGTPAAFDPAYPVHHITLTEGHSGLDVPILVGELPEIMESEPNQEAAQAATLMWPLTVNGRFQAASDVDWFRVRLEANQKIDVEVVAQRFIRSPVDTLVQVFNADGKLLVENDDEAFEPGYECYHDYKTTDSRLQFTAPVAGEFLLKVTEQNGAGGPHAVYRLTVRPSQPDFRLTHFPDAVPIWGPGTTACVMARIDRFAECQDDIEVSIAGLPDGWTTQSAVSLGRIPERYYNNYQNKVFLTITAPADAPIGTSLPFRVVGRVRPKATAATGAAISSTAAIPATPLAEHSSLPLNLFYTSDTGFFRASPVSRVAVAKPQGPWLEAITPELTLPQSGKGMLQVRVHNAGEIKDMPVVVSLASNGVACGLTTPQNIPIQDGIVSVPVSLPAELPIGVFGITVAQSWRNDIRVGMPGPCTCLLKLTVVPK
ncbi:MAG: PPC domain-containing protein [Planctomycetes bacterium]|nr:PPC domain-containing protein [Planctomycetota bacterium]